MPPKRKKAKLAATAKAAPDANNNNGNGNSNSIEVMSYPELLDRKQRMGQRLMVVSVPDASKKRSSSSSGGGKQEMMWLGADFQAERKRQVGLARKCASSIQKFHKTKETRRLRQLSQAEMKRRKLAAKMGRDVRGWWTKLEKVIAYKQKLEADEERKKAMNKQLVVLVQQTEKYTESLAAHTAGDTTEDEDGSQSAMDVDSETDGQSTGDESGAIRNQKRSKKRQRLTIEEALASEHKRKSKGRVIDYARMKLEATQFYGESTASDASGSDDSFSAPDDSDESDDDTTLRAAIEEELQERRRHKQGHTSNSGPNEAFLPDPDELSKLHEERTMDIAQVLQRLEDEEEETPVDEDGGDVDKESGSRTKRVKFAEESSTRKISASFQSTKPDPGEDADDDGDASDVEDYDEAKDHSDEEYEAGEVEADDETTIAREESLPKEMSHSEEIDMLKQSAEMPIEELRKMYTQMAAQEEGSDGQESGTEQGNASESSSVGDNKSDEEDYEMGEPEMDDETTIAQEEGLPREMSYNEEIDMLKAGAEMPIEDLRKMYGMAAMESDGEDEPSQEESEPEPNESSLLNIDDQSMDEDDEYEESVVPDVDDETTIDAEERLGRDMSYEDELGMLNRENEMSVEELRAMYAGMDGSAVDSDDDKMDVDEGASSRQDTNGDSKKRRSRRQKRKRDSSWNQQESGDESGVGEASGAESDEGAAALSALEASAEKARQTLASRPFLIAPWVKLRMYQQVGLNWLVSLQTRRLNGILADGMYLMWHHVVCLGDIILH
ncbi:MAG: hypothetical protein SGILL_001944 [Bacillariaceae sp.]